MEERDRHTLFIQGLSDSIRSHVLAISLAAALSAAAAFAVAVYVGPRAEVVAYVEIARLVRVENANQREELAVPAVVLAGEVNSGAFYRSPQGSRPGGAERRVRIIARVPVRTENVELTAQAASSQEAEQAIRALVERVSRDHAALQRSYQERAKVRLEYLDAELNGLQHAFNRADSALLASVQDIKAGDATRQFILTALRAQVGREIRELRLSRQSYAETIELMREKQTRLIGDPIPRRASLLPSFVAAACAGLLGGLATTLAFAMVSGRRRRKSG